MEVKVLVFFFDLMVVKDFAQFVENPFSLLQFEFLIFGKGF